MRGIMVLEFKVPEGHDWHALIGLGPKIVSYIFSFVYVGTNCALRYYSITSGVLVLAASAYDYEPAFRRFPIRRSDGQRLEGETISFTLLDCGLDRICECLDIRLLFRTCCRDLVHAG